MIILGIETSCDETAVSVIEGRGGLTRPKFRILSHVVASQVAIHAPWGGVVPMIAKREHGRNLVPVLLEALKESGLIKDSTLSAQGRPLPDGWRGASGGKNLKVEPWRKKNSKGDPWKKVKKILEREPELLEQFLKIIPTLVRPKIDAIAVTAGPGLEPALWTGINLAKALALVWDKPLIPINHMEGHIFSILPEAINPVLGRLRVIGFK